MTAHLEVLRQRDEARGRVAELEAMNTRLQGEVDRIESERSALATTAAKLAVDLADALAANTPLLDELRGVVAFLDDYEECPECGAAGGEKGDEVALDNGCDCCPEGRSLRRRLVGVIAGKPAVTGTTSDNAPFRNLDGDVFRPAALAAVAYLAAHAALAAAGVSEDRPAAARRVADAWIALNRACAEIPAGGPEPIRQAEPDWRAVATGLIKLVYARVSGPKIVDEVEAILQAYATPAGGPEQDRGAAALRPAESVDHAFLPHPWGKDICDRKLDEDGRARTCARPRREHGRGES